MNTIPTVDLGLTQLIKDLNAGLSWLEKDNRGAGSIQTKYDATEMQISVLKKHPKLKDIEPIRVNFRIIDDIEPINKEETSVEEPITVEERTRLEEAYNEGVYQ